MLQLIRKFKNFLLKIERRIFYTIPKNIYINNIRCKKYPVLTKETFVMPKLYDIFGNEHQYFDGYKAQTPDFYIWELPNAYCFTNREEVWTKNKELVLDHTTQKQNPMKNCAINFFKAKRIRGRVVNLSLNGLENNYYHWLTECLGRLYILKAACIEPDYYIVRNSLSFQKQWLELFGITQEKIAGLPDTGNEEQLITVDTLLITTFINNSEPIQYIYGFPSYKKIWLPSWIGNQYKEITQTYYTPPPPIHREIKKIFITRKNAKNRKIINEGELLKILNEHNFEVVDLDTISVIEQIKIFNSAKIIVGIHGAGLVNIFFCGAGSKLMEIYPPNYFDPSFRLLAINLNIDYTYMVGDEVDKNINPQYANIHIDKILFEKAIIKFDRT